jgi:hypothetical protein
MKVKELIEQLQKQNPEDEIHIWVDDEVGCGAGLYGNYYATEIYIEGHLEYYENEKDILSENEIMQYIKNYENYPDEQEYIIRYYEEINSRNKLKGTWIKIQP